MFLIQNLNDKETKALGFYCVMNRIPFKKVNNKKNKYNIEEYIPVGTIEWFLYQTGWNATPDYYPDFMKSYLGRKVWKQDKWPVGEKVFIKPADRAKRFNGRITDGSYKGKKKGPYWCSDIVHFVNEWRYYFADGKLLYTGWYDGIDDDKPAPTLDLSMVPKDYCGTLDFGETIDGRILLVEAHEPYSVGWYGKIEEGKIYAEFIEKGFNYLKNKYN